MEKAATDQVTAWNFTPIFENRRSHVRSKDIEPQLLKSVKNCFFNSFSFMQI